MNNGSGSKNNFTGNAFLLLVIGGMFLTGLLVRMSNEQERTASSQVISTATAVPAQVVTPTAPAPTRTPTSAPTPVPERSFAQIVNELKGAIVLVEVVRDDEASCASGVLVSSKIGPNTDFLVLTNFHVVEDALSVEITTPNGVAGPGEIIAIEQERDLALLQFDPSVWAADSFLTAAREAAPVWDYSSRGPTPPLGTEVAVLGYPACNVNANLTVTKGIVSSMPLIDDQRYMQTDAAMNPGVSGGLAITEEGRVAGLAVSGVPIFAENVGFLIPANEVDVNLSAWVSQIADGRMPDLAFAPTATPRPAPTATPRPAPAATPRPASKTNYQIEEEWKKWINPLIAEQSRIVGDLINPAMECRYDPLRSETCKVMRKQIQHEATVLWQKTTFANWPQPIPNPHPRWEDMAAVNFNFGKGVAALVHANDAYIDYYDSGRGTYADYERGVAQYKEAKRFQGIWWPLYDSFWPD